jgi:hypothetical protein
VQLSSFTTIDIILNPPVGSSCHFMWSLLTYFPTLGYNFKSIEVWEGISIWVNKGCTNFVIYFLLTCGLPIWQGSFSYKDMTACFGNLLALQRSLMCSNIVSKWQGFINVSKSFFLQGFPYSS